MELVGSRVLLLKDKPKIQTDSGLYLPDQVLEERNTGTVVLAGDKVEDRFIGKRVMFNKHTGNVIDYNGVPHTLIFSPDIIAII